MVVHGRNNKTTCYPFKGLGVISINFIYVSHYVPMYPRENKGRQVFTMLGVKLRPVTQNSMLLF